MLKRFKNNELGESASRRVSYHCTADYAKSSRSICRVCKDNIPQDELRLALMLQDEEGYKNTAWTHFDCFWKHPETKKLDGTHEIHNWSKLKQADQDRITAGFETLCANKAKSQTTKKKSTTRSRSQSRSQSNKRKKTIEEE